MDTVDTLVPNEYNISTNYRRRYARKVYFVKSGEESCNTVKPKPEHSVILFLY
jgi:hypothetical protein